MRILSIVLGLLMIVFAAVQLNDPDSLVWMLYYLIGAAFALLAAFRPALIQNALGRTLLWLCIAACAAAVIYYYPQMDRFWETEVWWEEETAREGMGVMILLLVLLVSVAASRPTRSA